MNERITFRNDRGEVLVTMDNEGFTFNGAVEVREPRPVLGKVALLLQKIADKIGYRKS